MSKAGSDRSIKSISVRVDDDMVDEFDMAIKKAQVNGDIPLDYTRSDVIREMIERTANDPDFLKEI